MHEYYTTYLHYSLLLLIILTQFRYYFLSGFLLIDKMQSNFFQDKFGVGLNIQPCLFAI